MALRPPGAFIPPTTPGVHGDTRSRLQRQEQRPDLPDLEPHCTITAGNAGPINTLRVTPRHWPWRGALHLEYLTIDAQGVDAETTVEVRRSGTTVISISFDADGVIREGRDDTWGAGDSVDLTVEGTVALLNVQLHFRGEGDGHLTFVVPAGGDA